MDQAAGRDTLLQPRSLVLSMRPGICFASVGRAALTVLPLFAALACAGDDEGMNPGDGDDVSGAGGAVTTGGGGTAAATGGSDTATGGDGIIEGSGGATGGSNTGGADLGSGGADTCAALPPLDLGPDLDCGSEAHMFQQSGPHTNRINYVILGDGYTSELVESTYLDHISNMLAHEQGMFGALSEPYFTYRKFINICALKVVSQDACIDDLDTGLECDTALGGYGDDASRLGIVEDTLVRAKVAELMPEEVDVDWTAVTINAGAENWWNSGGAIMVWNGGFEPAAHSASVALHEGGHAFHGLADEYDGTSTSCSVANELNVSTESSGAKWAEWLGFDHTPGTGLHGSYEGARYCSTGVYRPTENSEMNLLPDYFNMPSMQKMVHDFYAIVRPIDAHTDNSVPLQNPSGLQIRVVDPDVLTIEWSVDGTPIPGETGECFPTHELETGAHVVSVRVYDQTPWVRDNRDDLEQNVTWNITIE